MKSTPLLKVSGVRGESGFSLIQVVVSIGLVSVVLMAVASFNGTFVRQVENGVSLDQVDVFRKKLIAAVQSDEAWRRSMTYQENASMACLRNPQTPCPAMAFNPVTNPSLSIYNASGLVDEPQYDGNGVMSGSPPAGPVFDATYSSGGRFNGVTASGKKCFGFSPTVSTPNCPLRFNLRWYTLTGTSSPMVAVYGLLQVSPNTITGVNPNAHSIGQLDATGRLVNPIVRMAQ